jgi:hypothetical protein
VQGGGPARYALGVRTVRLYDPSRQPRDWMDIIQAGEYAVFPSRVEGGAPCTVDAVPTGHDAATCILVDSLAEAEALCRGHVDRHPAVRFDVFDSAGRSRPPLLTVVHPSHATRLEGHASVQRRNQVIAVALLAAAPVLFWIDWNAGGALMLPTLLAFNALLFAGRLLQVNAAYAAAERRRQERSTARPVRPAPPGDDDTR